MPKYRVDGTRREQGAFGYPETFWEFVEANNAIAAEEKVRSISYDKGFEHVHIEQTKLVQNT